MEPVTSYLIDKTLSYETTDSSGKTVELVLEKGTYTPADESEAAILERLCAAGVVSVAKASSKSKTTAEPKE